MPVAAASGVGTASSVKRAPNEPDSSDDALRPRLWVPGLVFVTPYGDVRLGRSVGYSSRDGSFRHLRCGYGGHLEAWTHVAWLVSRSELDRAIITEHAIILPESLIDPDALPHAHRWLRQQPVVCVSGATWRRLSEVGVQVFRLAFDASGDGVLDLRSSRDPQGLSSLTVSSNALRDATAVACEGRALLDVQGDPSPIDRVLRHVSGGALDETSVLNAFDARCIIEDGYGYRGALEGHFNDIDGLAGEFEALDGLFGQIFERATTMGTLADRLVAALTDAPPEACSLPVPLYGTAHQVVVPALRVPRGPRTAPDPPGGGRDLELPSERRWSVRGVDGWSPQLPTLLA